MPLRKKKEKTEKNNKMFVFVLHVKTNELVVQNKISYNVLLK